MFLFLLFFLMMLIGGLMTLMLLCNRYQYRQNMKILELLADTYEDKISSHKEENIKIRHSNFQWYIREINRQDEWMSAEDAYYTHIFNGPPEIQYKIEINEIKIEE